MLDLFTIGAVAKADLDLGQAGQHVELAERETREPVHSNRVAQHDKVEPAAASLASCGCAELLSYAAKVLAGRAGIFRGEGTAPDARGVSLGDAEHVVEPGRTDASTRAGAPRERGRRRDVGVGPVVDVEQGALGSLEQGGLAGAQRAVERDAGVVDVGRQLLSPLEGALGHLALVDRRPAIELFEQEVPLRQRCLDTLAEGLGLQQVLDANARAGNAALVGGADTPTRSTDRGRADLFAGFVERGVYRQDHVRSIGDAQAVAGNREALRAQPVELRKQHLGIDDDAGTDQVQRARNQNSRRDQMENRGLSIDDECMPGVRAALEADHQVGPRSQAVDDLSLAFVAPLGTDAHDVWHRSGHLLAEVKQLDALDAVETAYGTDNLIGGGGIDADQLHCLARLRVQA